MDTLPDINAEVERAVSALQNPNVSIRIHAVDTIGKLQHPRSLPLLIHALHHNDDSVKIRAVENIYRYRYDIPTSTVLPFLAQDHINDEVLSTFIGLLLISKTEDKSEISTPLLVFLKHTSPLVRASAVYALSEIREGRAIDALLALLDDAEPHEYVAIIQALSKFGDIRAFDALLVAFQNHDNPVLQMYAAVGLGRIRSAKALVPLYSALNGKEGTVQSAAIEAIGMIGGKDALNLLLTAFGDESRETYVREEAALTLAHFSDPLVTQVLRDALQHPLAEIRIIAAVALARQGDDTGIDILLAAATNPTTDTSTIIIVFDALKLFGRHTSIPMLVLFHFLSDAFRGVRIRGAETLGEIGKEEAIEPLIVTAKTVVDDETRDAIVRALTHIGTVQAYEAIHNIENE